MLPKQIECYRQIRELLKEAYEHYFTYEGYCKSSEGAIEIYYPNYFRQCDGLDVMAATGIGIYSYCLGPSRKHLWFLCAPGEKPRGDDVHKWVDIDPLEAALRDVREWHREEMAFDPDEVIDA